MYTWTWFSAYMLYMYISSCEGQKLFASNASEAPTTGISLTTEREASSFTMGRAENHTQELTSDQVTFQTSIGTSATTKNMGNVTKPYEFRWWLCAESPQPEPRYKKECCSYEYRKFQSRWSNGGFYLTTFLDKLKRWNCTEFEEECLEPTYAFDEFTRLVYDQICSEDVVPRKCTENVRELVETYGFIEPPEYEEHVTENRWDVLIESLNSSQMHLNDLSQPCIGIALYDRKDGGPGRFHEILEPYIPFCSLQWVGYDLKTAMERKVSPWTSMSIRCRASIVLCMVIMVIATVVTIVANSTILGVFYKTPKLRNSQAVYKISLAMADLLVGLFVWANMIVTQDWISMSPRSMGAVVTPHNPNSTTWQRYYFPMPDPSLEYRKPGGKYKEVFPKQYVNFVGFFVTFSLIISVYTLMFASFDRFWAVFRPLRYNRHNAKRQAKIICAVLWLFSFVLALLPVFIKDIKYKVISAIFVTSDGTTALALLFIGFIIPLIIVWVITIGTFQSSKRHARNRQRIVSANASSYDKLEIRLAKTLAMMVGIFSISVVPAIMCIIGGFLLPYTQWKKPKNLNIYSAMVYTSCEYVAILLLTSNSFWNCMIYSIRTHGFRQATKTIYENLMKKSGIKSVGRGAMFLFSSARRVSLSSLYNMRNMSSSSQSDLRKKSVSSLVTGTTKVSETRPSIDSSNIRPSVDYSSTAFMDSSTSASNYSGTYTKSGVKGSKPMFSGAGQKAGKKKKEKDEEWVEEDSTFGSFAVDAGADRFFVSVMEDVEELEEDENSTK